MPPIDQPPLSGYSYEQTLGQGASGHTYLVKRLQDQQLYVLKEQHFKNVKNWKEVELFEREAKILQQIKHPRIPAFVDLIIQRDTERSNSEKILLVQEYIAGQNLEQRIETGQHFTEKQVVKLALEIVEVLSYLHSLNPSVIHRDIKPANIMIHREKGAFLVDFGAVKNRSQQRSSTIVGTFGYMAPEQFDGRAYPATDIYALGVSLIFALTHVHPGDMEKEVLRLNYRPHGQISKPLSNILDKMIAPDWKARYQNARELKKDLENIDKITVKPSHFGAGGILLLVLALFYLPSELEAPVPVKQKTLSAHLPTALQTARWQGTLSYRGKVMDQWNPEQVKFWFRDENTGKKVSDVKGYYHKGHIWFSDLPHTRLLIQVTVKTETGWALNFERSKVFNLFTNSIYPLDVELLKVIHLTSPENNMQKLPPWDKQNDRSLPPKTSAPIHLAWEPLEENLSYKYRVENWRFENDKYVGRETVFDDTTQDTSLYLQLEPSKPNHYYVFKLSAHDKQGKIGYLTVHRKGRKSWDYRFRIETSTTP